MTTLSEILNGRAAQGENGHSPASLADFNGHAASVPDGQVVLESAQDLAEAARKAIAEAVAGGVPRDELHKMVVLVPNPALDNELMPPLQGLEPESPPIFDTLPPGFIDLPSAGREYGVNRQTLHSWLKAGHITQVGRLRGRSPGRGFVVVSEQELLAYMNAPRNKGGRPKKQKHP